MNIPQRHLHVRCILKEYLEDGYNEELINEWQIVRSVPENPNLDYIPRRYERRYSIKYMCMKMNS